jgi:hypothetical protein
MKKNYFLFMIVLGFLSCQKDGSLVEVNIYVAGTVYNEAYVNGVDH